jgi:hypothetical protein
MLRSVLLAASDRSDDMVFHIVPALLLGAFLDKSELLSHITERVVDAFGGEPADDRRPLVTVINRLPEYPTAPSRYPPGPPRYPASPSRYPSGPSRQPNPADWMVVPPPERFVMLSGQAPRPCVMGVMMDGLIGDPPAIRWNRVLLDTPVTVELSNNDLGTFFAEIVPAAGTLNLRQVQEFDRSNGHRVFALRT